MNGIGGSGDFTRNAHIAIYTCPSIAKKGTISTIVPLVTHLDHSEHSVQVVVTVHGIADLRITHQPLARLELDHGAERGAVDRALKVVAGAHPHLLPVTPPPPPVSGSPRRLPCNC